jgi:hypothetical protein
MVENIELKRKFIVEIEILREQYNLYQNRGREEKNDLFKAVGRQIFKLEHLAGSLSVELPAVAWFEQRNSIAKEIDLKTFGSTCQQIAEGFVDEISNAQVIEEIEVEKQKAVEELGLPVAQAADQEFLHLADNQKTQVQSQINALRDAIDAATFFEDEKMNSDYCYRLLNKVNELQTEFSKDVSSYYRGLGRMVDLAEALGESGKKIKPVTDRLKEVTDSLKFFKKQAAIGKDEEPKKIPDMRDEGDHGDED